MIEARTRRLLDKDRHISEGIKSALDDYHARMLIIRIRFKFL